ncbi:hypothetical protein B0H10DRAFT_2349038 [Mycena sp. CBHHK59/15]|nr:hypothetical protein B0H10DRAFT_2349038 [Mycena sp. CBHHK59/15]
MYHPQYSFSFAVPPIVDYIYSLDPDSQLEASVILAQHSLDADSRELIGNRWSQQWSYYFTKDKDGPRRILYLCACGYDHHHKEHHTGAPFTGCLAHVEITVRSNKILRIRGHFEHNQGCCTGEFCNIPPIPVHPSVYAVALAQLRDGATFNDVPYKDFPVDLAASPYRWILTQNDSRSLYRQYNRMKGVTVTNAPEINVDDWLDPKSDKFNPTLAQAIFHYSARTQKGERFEVAIATDDMNRAAWAYGHESQIILDGTFGVCDSRLLLFIVMVVDENRKGVPVAFLLFSAPTGNRQSSSGYNTEILTKLLRKWADSLNKCAPLYGRAGVIFKPLSAITDTDLKERGALIAIWVDIWLLICRFHLRQAWRNHRNKLLKGKKQVYIDLKHRMNSVELALVATQTISEARELLEAERQVMVGLSAEHPRAARKATEHINYLDSYWTTDNLWPSWSDYGRTVLASMLGAAVDGVIPTTNHLESFNRVFKRIHLLRVDVLIHAIVVYILPSIFEERRVNQEQASRIATLIRLLPGGAALLEQKRGPKAPPPVPKIAYLVPDADRDERARDLVANRQISAPTLLPANAGLTVTSYSSRALSIETTPTIYTIQIGFNGAVTCKCADFQERGGACKHIRGALIILDDLRRRGINIPHIPIPLSLADAQALQVTMLASTVPPKKADLPTSRAAEKIEDILRDETALDDSLQVEDKLDSEDDDASVATDESSDSDSDSDEEDAVDTFAVIRATQNVAALGEQAVSRTIYELRDIEPKLGDLGQYLDQRVFGLSPDELKEVGQCYGHLMDFVSKLERVMSLPLPPPQGQLPTSQLPSTVPSTSTARPEVSNTSPTSSTSQNKRKQLLPPSPEQRQKRHQSHTIH